MLATLTALALLPTALAARPDGPPVVRCRTLELLDGAFLAPELQDGGPPPPPTGKALRDPYGVPNSHESDNFVLRWGSGVSTAEAEAVLAAFEHAWQVEVSEMAHPAPPGTDATKFNVYVGSSGGNTPSHYDAAGYFTTDPDGWPMIVLNPGTVDDMDYGETVVAHEFYHALQYATGSYTYEDEGAWFWEATASWVEVEVYPDNPGYVAFLFGYALIPHLELNFFDYPDTGALQEYHQYGAFIWPRYLTEFVGDWRIVRNAWVDPQTGTNDPLEALRLEVADLGVDMDAAFMDFAARNVTWDYLHGSWYAQDVEGYAPYFPDEDARVVLEADRDGTGGAFSPPSSLRPRRYGVNVVSLERPVDGDLVVDFVGDAEGSRGDAADWGLTLVRERGGAVSYEPLLLGGTEVSTTVPDVGGDDALYVVVGAWSDRLRWDQTYDYELTLLVDEGGGDDPGPGGDDTGPGGDDTGPGGDVSLGDVDGKDLGGPGWGCSSRPGAALGLLAGLFALVGLGARRR